MALGWLRMAKRRRICLVANSQLQKQELEDQAQEQPFVEEQKHTNFSVGASQPSQGSASQVAESHAAGSYNSGESGIKEDSQPAISIVSLRSKSLSTQKKVRGPTRMPDIWDLESSQRVEVTVNEYGQPVGEEGCSLTRFIGTLVRMSRHAPINYADWRAVPIKTKEDLWRTVKDKFVFSPSETEATKKWVIADIGRKWKSWKFELKARLFDPSVTSDKIMDNLKDNRVDKEQLRELLSLWFKPEYQAICKQKKNSRSKVHVPHCLGTKSFARLCHEEAEKSNGVRPSRSQLYIRSRTRKNGSLVNIKAASIVENLKNCLNESSNSCGVVGSEDWRNDDLSKVRGPESRGHVRCIGRIPAVKDKAAIPLQDIVRQSEASEATTSLQDIVRQSEFADATTSLQDIARQSEINELRADLVRTQGIVSSLMEIMREHLPHLDLANIGNKQAVDNGSATDGNQPSVGEN